ncbi:lipoteichoic acid biosynthesis MFS flippase LtaA [Mammaliicoccus stepanovicii]|uniref:Major facilitator superfamily permease n=1 Tax=Mammaliicoccus stepanovicii TaxID=643214 RepID=A0A239ZT67_9STAP|nr:MFS transporter [Mammaliicoccus stepanovicii]PNZ77099.1 MFS transporter [Mammaliicoccus stepanovicii]GGI38797.1 putative glycolipid permease LtaA [Mammaliicoccus stepanovicii]SNV73856.1 major facilitator superfamily permease [Mammaliicoccus stepanovicii]
MPNISSGKSFYKKDFWIMLVILFMMEFARGMYILSYLPILPTTTAKVTVGITSLAISLHFISDALTNFVIGFLLKRFGPTIILTSGFVLAFSSLALIIFIPSPVVFILSAILLGIAVSPIWVIMLSSVAEESRGKQMGYVYFSWLVGMLSGMIFMNLLFKLHPTRFTFMMSLCVLIAWILFYFVKVQLTNYEDKSIKKQFKEIVFVTRRHLLLFPGIFLQGSAIGMLVPILPTYATKHMGVSTLEYTIMLIVGGVGCTISMLFFSKLMDKYAKIFTHVIIFFGFFAYSSFIFGLTILTQLTIVLIIALVIGTIYGLLLPAWNTFMASHIHSDIQEETWGVFNSVQGFGTMIGPLIGGLISEIFRDVYYTIYGSSLIFLFLAIFYGSYFVITHKKKKA